MKIKSMKIKSKSMIFGVLIMAAIIATVSCASTKGSAEPTEYDVLISGTKIHYAKSGKGAPLLLLHGNGEDHHIFDAAAKKLALDFTVYAIDFRNHGRSDMTNIYSYDTMAADIYAFIMGLKLKKPHIIGFSDGAIVALITAMQHSSSLGKLELLGINLKPSDIDNEIYAGLAAYNAEHHEPLIELMLTQPNIELQEAAKIKNKTLIVGAQSDIIKPETFTNLNNAISGSKLIIMQGHEHDSYIVNTDIFYPEMVEFLKEK